jgi:hypothetical protein
MSTSFRKHRSHDILSSRSDIFFYVTATMESWPLRWGIGKHYIEIRMYPDGSDRRRRTWEAKETSPFLGMYCIIFRSKDKIWTPSVDKCHWRKSVSGTTSSVTAWRKWLPSLFECPPVPLLRKWVELNGIRDLATTNFRQQHKNMQNNIHDMALTFNTLLSTHGQILFH